jgi:hypothetical protein
LFETILIANYACGIAREILHEGVVGTYMLERHVKVAKVAIMVGVTAFLVS